MNAYELIGIFVVFFFVGLSVGVFTKHFLRIFLFFMGFYFLLTFALVMLHVITVNVSVESVLSMFRSSGSNLLERVKSFLRVEYGVAILGFLIGFYFGLKKG